MLHDIAIAILSFPHEMLFIIAFLLNTSLNKGKKKTQMTQTKNMALQMWDRVYVSNNVWGVQPSYMK